MTYSIDSFISNNSNCSLYKVQVGFETLVRLFGDWYSYNTLVKYNNIFVDLNVITILKKSENILDTTLIETEYVHVHVWINGSYISDQEIKFKNVGSPLIYLLDDLVSVGIGTKKEF